MTVTNPHPLANPLNQGRFSNFSYGQSSVNKQFVRVASPKDLTVPEAKPYDPNATSHLEVPNSDIPYYNGPVPASGFLGDSSMLKLVDGTVLDLKACKIVYDPNAKWKAKGYWNDPCGTLEKPNGEKEWGATETIESMLANVGKPTSMDNDPNLSPESIRYWKKAAEESKKLEQSLTDEQKSLLADLQAGKMFPLTKLVEES